LKTKAKVSTKKRKGSQSSDLSEIEWSEEEDSPKKGGSSIKPKNLGKTDASSKSNSKAEEEDLKRKKAAFSPAKKPK
jgi:hypothetical protein